MATGPRATAILRLAAVFCAGLLVVAACGGGDGEFSATCSLQRSELGPFSEGSVLAETVDEQAARAQMAADGIVEWIEIRAEGDWNEAWEAATGIVGNGIHQDLSWIDAEGEIEGLYEPGDSFAFENYRVSRSFQGKLETADEPLYIRVLDGSGPVNYEAGCEVTALIVGNEGNDNLVDALKVLRQP